MRRMKRLAIILADDNPERLRTALVLASAHAALQGNTRLFFQGAAVAMLKVPIADPDGIRQSATGLPTIGQLFEEAIKLGVSLTCCQSSMALLDLVSADFDGRIEWGGMIGFLSMIEPGRSSARDLSLYSVGNGS